MEAQERLALHYLSGDGVEKNVDRAIDWWQKASKSGDAAASNALGNLYADGTDVPRDYRQALHWYETAVAQGGPGLEWVMAEIHSTLGEDQQAFDIYEKLAIPPAHGRWAQTRLADFYSLGKGVAQSDAKAAEWYAKAAVEGHSIAQYRLGQQYADGKGVPKDPVMAYFLISLSATAGSANVKHGFGIVEPYESFRYLEVAKDLNALAMTMSMLQIAESQTLLAGWHRGEPLPSRPK